MGRELPIDERLDLSVRREQRLDEAIAEYLDLIEAGEAPPRQEFLDRHADLLPELQSFFADHDGVEAWAREQQEKQGTDTGSAQVSNLTAKGRFASAGLTGRLGRFELGEVLGKGAFGTVYRAWDPQLERMVAVKVAHARVANDDEDLRRFQREARSMARLRHPGIVGIHEVGESDGVIYLVRAYVHGQTLAKVLKSGRPALAESVALIIALADALYYAHSHGVIHRDIKPSNILIDEAGVPHLIDFGLARRTQADATLTTDGQVLGTPAYMSPEQAQGQTHQADGRADIYSLGVVLYRLLTGELPFAGPSPMVLHQQMSQEPRSPRSLIRDLPRDLETICLRAMRKAPDQRYSDAKALGDDLRRFLEGKPILARPVGMAERCLKWIRCHRAAAVAYGLLLIAVMLGGLATWKAFAQSRVWPPGDLPQLVPGPQEEKARHSYLNAIGLAYREWQHAEVGRAKQILADCPIERRGWEWHYVNRLCHADIGTFAGDGPMVGVAFSQDGSLVTTVSNQATLKVWDTESGRVREIPQDHSKIGGAAFDDDCQQMAMAEMSGSLRMRNVWTGKETLAIHKDELVRAFALHPSGAYLATATNSPVVKLWDARSGKPLKSFTGLAGLINGISLNGNLIAAISNSNQLGQLRVWDWQTGQPVLRIDDPNTLDHLRFSSDGKYLAATNTKFTVHVWAIQTGRAVSLLAGHTDFISALEFSRDSTKLATGSQDQTVRVWDLVTGREVARYRGHTQAVGNLAFSPNSQRLATASHDSTVKLWDLTNDPAARVLSGHTSFISSVKVSPDAQAIASTGCDGTLRIWDLRSGRQTHLMKAHTPYAQSVAYSPDGKWLVSGGNDGRVRLWDAVHGSSVWSAAGHTDLVLSVAFSFDGKFIASASGSYDAHHDLRAGDLKLWDTLAGKEVDWLQGNRHGFDCVAFSPDGKYLAGGGDGTMAIWDMATGACLHSFPAHDESVVDVAFSPNSQQIVTASYDKTVKVWDASSAAPLLTIRGCLARVTCVAFSPDGRRIACGGDDHFVRIFLAESGEECLSLAGTTGPVHTLAFSSDGHTLVSGGWDKLLRIWDARP